jgi:hypothetical protein
MVKRRKKTFDLSKQLTVKTFFRITGIDYIGNELSSKITSAWTEQGITNRQKSFIFKYFNNILGINTGTSHFAANGTRNCLFCSKKIHLYKQMRPSSICFLIALQYGPGSSNFYSMLPGNGDFRWHDRKKTFYAWTNK